VHAPPPFGYTTDTEENCFDDNRKHHMNISGRLPLMQTLVFFWHNKTAPGLTLTLSLVTPIAMIISLSPALTINKQIGTSQVQYNHEK